MNRTLAVAGAAGAIAVLGYVLARGRGTPARPPVRAAFELPRPTPEEKVDFQFDLMQSGAQAELGNRLLPVWRLVGERSLVTPGMPALDVLLAPGRMETYRREPQVLANVLRILPDIPGAGGHPRTIPFTLHWLDPANCPRPAPGADWVSDLRLSCFVVLQRFPRPEAVPACLDEMRRDERVHDLRKVAMDILLGAHRGAALAGLYDRLPPCAAEPAGDHRTQLMVMLHALAGPGRSTEDRAQAEELEPILRRGARSTEPGERINALAALARLGHDEARAELEAIFRTCEAEGDEVVGWSALDLLARDGPSDFVREACLAKVTGPGAFTQGAGRGTALRLLARWWLDDPDVRDLLWRHMEGENRIEPLHLLPALARGDRARTVRFLEAELRSGDMAKRIPEALRFIAGHPVPEAGPVVFDLARAASPEVRPVFYAVLASLETPGTEALLRADLDGAPRGQVREAAVAGLLQMGGAGGLEDLARAVEEGDPVVMEALLQRAMAGGADGVPAALLPGVLGRLGAAPGEEERRLALFILRFRGTLSGVGDGLMEAYRTEPSRELAREIRAVLVELAHR